MCEHFLFTSAAVDSDKPKFTDDLLLLLQLFSYVTNIIGCCNLSPSVHCIIICLNLFLQTKRSAHPKKRVTDKDDSVVFFNNALF